MMLLKNYSEKLYCMRDLLRNNKYEMQAKKIDIVASQFDGLTIGEKEESLNNLQELLSSKSLKNLTLKGITTSQWRELIDVMREGIKYAYSQLKMEIQKCGFPDVISYEGTDYSLRENVIDFVEQKNHYVLILKNHDKKYFDDNMICLDQNGKIIWSSKEIIPVPNRMGACFVYIAILEDKYLSATAWVGVSYKIDIEKGCVIDSQITK